MKIYKKKHSKERNFSKTLILQESVLIWIMTLGFLGLAALCILKDYVGSLPWLTAMVSFPWAAYGVSQCFYYNKSKAENTQQGIKYESVMAELQNKLEIEKLVAGQRTNIISNDFDENPDDYKI